MKQMRNKYHLVFGILLLVFATSCDQIIKNSNDILSQSKATTLEGKYFPLEKHNIKLFLPKEFRNLSLKDYMTLVEKTQDSVVIALHRNKLETLRKANTDLYVYEYLESGSVLNVIPTEYFKFKKEDAQYLLNSIRYEHDKVSAMTGIHFTKNNAQFIGNDELQIFKADYTLTGPNIEGEFYKQIYLVSFNKSTFYLMLETPFLVDFDPYLQKIRVL